MKEVYVLRHAEKDVAGNLTDTCEAEKTFKPLQGFTVREDLTIKNLE